MVKSQDWSRNLGEWSRRFWNKVIVVATTRHSRTNDLTISKALSRLLSNEWGITRELDKEPSLYCSSIYISYKWSMLQQYYSCPNVHASSSCPITHPHVFSIRPPCFLYVPWRHTLNHHCTCTHHVYTMRNPCPLMSSPNPNSISRLFPILLDPKSFQTALDFITWLPGYVPIS